MSIEEQLESEAAAPGPQQNPFGRKRNEAAGPEELLSHINRQMPFSDEAEKGVISSLLQDPMERIQETRLLLPSEAFYHEANRVVYEKLLEFSDSGQPIDPVLITNALRDQGLLERVGGPAKITELFGFVPVPSHYTYYRNIVQSKWILRRFIHANAQNIDDAHTHGHDDIDASVGKLLAKGEERVFKLLDAFQSSSGGSQIISSTEAMITWVEAFEKICDNRGQPLGVQTGWVDVDRAFHGLGADQEGDFLLVGGYPGMGKTGAAVSLLENIAIEQRIPCAMFPLEMGVVGFNHRLVLGRAGIDVSVSRNGFLKRQDMGALAQAQRDVAQAPIHWDNSPFIEVDEMVAKVTMLNRRHGTKVCIFDHFGQIKPSSKEGKRDLLVGQREIVEAIHGLRRRLGVLIILLIQLDKAGREKQAKNRPPGPGDVRGASELVEYPTQIMFIHRPDEVVKWNGLDEKRQDDWRGMTHGYRLDFPGAWHDGRGLPEGHEIARADYEEHARVVIVKNRHGPTTDDIVLRYRKNLQRFVGRTLKLYSNNEKFRQVKLPGF